MLYGLVGLTFTAIYNVSKVINFSQGEFAMMGGILAYAFLTVAHVPILVGLVAAVAITAAVALAMQRLVVSPLLNKGAPLFTVSVATIGCAGMISGVAGPLTNFQWVYVVPFLGSNPLHFAGAIIMPQQIILIAATVLMVGFYWFLLKKTPLGMSLRAAGCDQDVARLLGIRLSVVTGVAFAISASMAALAGFLVAPLISPQSGMGLPLVIKGFVAAVLGGLGNPYAAVVGGLGLGLVGSVVSGYFGAVYAEIVMFFVLLGVLLWRPEGIFGERV